MNSMADQYNDEMIALCNKFSGCPLTDLAPELLFREIRPGGLLSVGINPSFNEKRMDKRLASEGYRGKIGDYLKWSKNFDTGD